MNSKFKKYLFACVLFMCSMAVAFLAFSKDVTHDDMVALTNKLVTATRDTEGSARFLEEDDKFTDGVLKQVYEDYDRQHAQEQIDQIMAQAEQLRLETEAGQALGYRDFKPIVLDNDTTLDKRANNGFSLVTWTIDNRSVFYTTFAYHWNMLGKLDALSVVMGAATYMGGGI